MKKILITGGSGFLGAYLIDHFIKYKYQIRILVRKSNPSIKSKNIETINGNLLDPESISHALKNIDYVIHAAALSSFWKLERKKMYEINVTGTKNLISECLNSNIQKFLHIDSVTSFGVPKDDIPITENSSVNHDNFTNYYAETKYLAQKEVLRGIEKGLPGVLCIPGIMLGPGNWNMGSPSFFKMMYEDKFKFYTTGSYGLVAAKDVATVSELLLKSKLRNGEKYILVSQNVDAKKFIELLARSLDKPCPKKAPPKKILRFLGFVLELISYITRKEPFLTLEKSKMMTRDNKVLFDGNKITKDFNFKYSDVNEVIQKTAQQFLSEV